ncbi:DUF4876 domain-containing protein [Porphyromonas somerae]|uniref:DUF4876 domain-containing protein n=1 Tax=Porphyromonas somerae TaxID=322095 RepID=UPI002A763AD8|nr:DUF4876 domain-containing protein [Porphyromonas somerae]MDY3119911.1 DUF4876 domain-containing protein [Porphyromonas somerae]
MKQNCIYLVAIAIIASLLSSCHNGGEKPADQEKVLDHLVFEELCYSGTQRPATGGGSTLYEEDHYLKIANPTDEAIYLDGMGIAISGISAIKNVNMPEGTDFSETHFCAGTLLRFPGEVGGTKYPIKPKSSVLLATVAHNHTIPGGDDPEDAWHWNKNSMDLSKADFEWATPEQIEYAYDDEILDNPDVPNLRQLYPDGIRSNNSILMDGYAIALIKFPKELTDEAILLQKEDNPYFWGYTFTTDDQGGGHSHGGKRLFGVKIPYSMVVDAVQLSTKISQYRIKAVDKGCTSIYESNKDNIFPRSVFRKFDGLKFVDDDDSSTDFEVREASLAPKS